MHLKPPTKKPVSSGRFSALFEKHPYLVCAATAFLINSVIEIYSRHSFISFFEYILSSPFAAFYSVAIIILTLFISLLFSKRIFVYTLISILWLSLGIANGTVLMFRVTPLTGVDFSIIWSVLGIIEVYLKPWQIALIAGAIVIAAVFLVFLAVKAPSAKANRKKAAAWLAALCLAIVIATGAGLETGAISDEFPNLADAYDDYGFAYCFARSVLDTGIKRPQGYKETISDIKSNIGRLSNNKNNTSFSGNPNVILVQLESFFDPSYMKEYELSEDAVPNFRRLKNSCPSGFLTVPAVGAGTANTEFEVLTGMNLDYFGTCEYPYKTVLNDTATCSLCTDLKGNGYKAHALHNNTGTFYDRDTVYSYLGFDTFTPLEYMLSPEYNELGWAKDSMLTDEIIRTLNSTKERDFVFAVSVQAHGKYPRKETAGKITVTGSNSSDSVSAVSYYVNQIHEVDKFIGELTASLSQYREPVILVLYGDHLPSLELEDEDLATGDVFKTEYVLWSNRPTSAASRDLTSWQLTPYIMETLGLEGGPVTTLHLTESCSADFEKQLEALEYDLLYGDFALFDGKNPYSPTDMQMGSSAVEISDIYESAGNLYIKGCNFTPFTKIYIENDSQETEYIDSFTLAVKNIRIPENSVISALQVTESGVILGRTEFLQN